MTSLRSDLKRRWRAFAALPSGERFARFHAQQKDAPAWVKPLLIVAAVASIAVGVVLVFIPGPAFVFFGLAGAMLATQSVHVARLLDRLEVVTRALLRRARTRWDALRRRGRTVGSDGSGAVLAPPNVVPDDAPSVPRSASTTPSS